MNNNIPLAEFIRPKTLNDFVGQKHLTAENKILFNAVNSDNLQSYLFWGPPGTGKTTLANIIAYNTKSEIIMLDSISANTKKLREIFAEAEKNFNNNIKTIVFIDEIHRYNKKQQDIFLPYIENGKIYLISATTENPSFELNNQLLSRLKILKLNPLNPEEIFLILKRCVSLKNNWNTKLQNLKIEEQYLKLVSEIANGDARQGINLIETLFISAVSNNKTEITKDDIKNAVEDTYKRYDKRGEEHYNLISAMHKSLRGSDIEASVYWTVRMLESGEDPLYICRRLIRMACEDIGVADTNALTVALNAQKTYSLLGSPEGELAIIEAVIYLASAPKSNSVYTAYNKAKDFVHNHRDYPVPMNIVNAPTKVMKDLGYSKNYKYPFNFDYNFAVQNYLPEQINKTAFYIPQNYGYEKTIYKRIKFWDKLKKQKKS